MTAHTNFYKVVRYFLISSVADATGALTVMVKFTLYLSDKFSSLHKKPSNSSKLSPAIFVILSIKMCVMS